MKITYASRILQFSLLLISVSSFAQNYSENTKIYYAKLYAAEQYLIGNKIKTATYHYNKLLNSYKEKSNTIDIYNALLLNLMEENKQQTEFCIRLLALKNIKIYKLMQLKGIDSLSKLHPELITPKTVAKYSQFYKVKPWIKSLDSVYKIDQAVRENNSYSTKEGQRAIYITDSINSYFLKDFLRKYGFMDSEGMLYGALPGLSKLETMLVHQTMGQHRKEYISIIIGGVNRLEIKPGVANYIIDVMNGYTAHETVALFQIMSDSCENKYHGKWLSYKYQTEVLNKIEGIRKKDLLEEWDFYIAKCIYSIKHPLFNWHNSFSCSIMNFATCADLTSYIQNFSNRLKVVE